MRQAAAALGGGQAFAKTGDVQALVARANELGRPSRSGDFQAGPAPGPPGCLNLPQPLGPRSHIND